VDAIVTDARGRAVDTLKAADFTVIEQGQPQPVASAQFVRGETRLLAIFLDEFHTTAGDAATRVRDTLAHAIRDDLAPGDQVVVFKPLDSILAITMTTDHAAAAQAIETFEGRKGDYAARSAFERNYIAGTPARIDAARAQIALSALNALAQHLGARGPGRKSLLVVSDGLSRRPRTRGGDALPTFDTVQQTADRARVAVYALEMNRPGEDAADPVARDGLRALAGETGGRTISAGDDVDAALRGMLADSSGYYAVTLQAHGSSGDGRFHQVDVRVRRAGTAVRARSGYFAESAEELRRRAALLAPPEPRVVEPPHRISPLIRAWFGMSRGNAGATRVNFVWEPAPRVPGVRSIAQPPARVALNVSALDGTPIFDGVVLPSSSGTEVGGSEPSHVSFEMPPGRLRVRMAIEDAASRLLDTDVRDLIVAGFPGPVTLGTAEVLRARNAREYRALAADPDAPPVAARQFSRAERLLVRVAVYAAGGTPSVSATLVSRFGQALRGLPVTPAGGDEYQVDLPLAGLAAGEYAIEVRASIADASAKETVAIRVTP
jgi:VWFA-related protein